MVQTGAIHRREPGPISKDYDLTKIRRTVKWRGSIDRSSRHGIHL